MPENSKNNKLTINKINDIFEGRRPGAENGFNFFSVLVPLVDVDGELNLLYEVRGKNLDRQPGEICFPGGALEDDETYEECAVRETCEELGIRPEDIRIISQLDTIYTYNNFAMFCFLGVIDKETLGRMNVSEVEVADTFLVPLQHLMDNPPDVYMTQVNPVPAEDFPYDMVTGGEPYKWRGGKGIVPVYGEYEGHVIWGLTGRITKRLVEVIEERM
ncbi:MAG: CoA pyrophosphatase [Eubacterium sp.]|nr:CoA pyrophosphatase [Candidatus Colimonas fimequi]